MQTIRRTSIRISPARYLLEDPKQDHQQDIYSWTINCISAVEKLTGHLWRFIRRTCADEQITEHLLEVH